MTDAHCHCVRGETRHLLSAPFTGEPGAADIVFYGTHPWDFEKWQGAADLAAQLESNLSRFIDFDGISCVDAGRQFPE